MIIIYIEENIEGVGTRMRVLKRLLGPLTIKTVRQRQITLTSGLVIYVIAKYEMDKIRGLEALAVFVNCSLDAYDRAGAASIVRGK